MIFINNQRELDDLNIETIRNVDKIKISDIFYIPEGKFANLNKLKSIEVDSVYIIDSGAFLNCKNLTNITLNNKPYEIRDFAFCNTQIGFIPELYLNTKFGVYNNLGENIVLDNITWLDLITLINLNIHKDYFSIGDTKKIKIDNYTYYCQIYDFEHDIISIGNKKSNITFGFLNCLSDNHHMNSPTDTDVWGTNIGGWKKSEMRTYLNSDFLYKLPIDLQNNIKTVIKYSDNGYSDKPDLVSTEDKIFIPSLEEIGYINDYTFRGQGYKYSLFNDKKYILKFNVNMDTFSYWWLRSSNFLNDYNFYQVNSFGIYTYQHPANKFGVAPCFCV